MKICTTANGIMKIERFSAAVSADTRNVVASTGCAGKLISIASATTAFNAESVAIQRHDPTRDA